MLIDYTQCGQIIKASELFQAMPIKSVVTCNAMIRGYGQNGEVAKVREVFDNMRDRDDRTWSAMIKVYKLKGFDLEALDLFALMQREDIRPNFPLSVLSVCGSLVNLDYGRQIHAQLVRNQFDLDVYVASVLMTMFVKCGDLVKAKQVFDRFSAKDIVMWNSMITSYAQHGLGGKALQLFDEMCSLSIAADEITFVGVLLACSYSGNVEKGLEIFETMKSNYQVEPGTAHFACMVDLLGRVGQVNEVMGLINRMPVEANAIVWGAVLGACRQHMKMDLAEVAAKKLTELEPYKARPYVLLSGRWYDVVEVRENMRARSLRKLPGCSWIVVEKNVHMFTGGESTGHPKHEMIMRELERLGVLLRETGYCPDGSFVLHDVEEEEKAHSLVIIVRIGHSIWAPEGTKRDANSFDEEP
nr:pentatricopeptide repeat-containing protein At1g56690, mitochondrial [Malus domestica]